ncbi:MAG: FAD-dependent oxidoreductase [Candidatus Dormibacteria bacterium]
MSSETGAWRGPQPGLSFDVAVIGAGVVGAAIARQLSHYQVNVLWLEAGDDVGTGTSKANTAIWHTGFDATPGSLEARLVQRGHRLLAAYSRLAGIPLETTGALMVAWTSEELGALHEIRDRAEKNGYSDVELLEPAALRALEPNLGSTAQGALLIPQEGILCPFTTPLALATDAVLNGVDLRLLHPVTRVNALDSTYLLSGPDFEVEAAYVVNAAGLRADTVDSLFCSPRIEVKPRRGELIVFDKAARSLIRHILLPVPSSMGKGVLVAPTVFGNLLLGPTAENVDSPYATETTTEGLHHLMDRGRRIVPRLEDQDVTALYAGVRAATQFPDYQIRADGPERYVLVGGIRSTGLSSSLAIGEHVRDLLDGLGCRLVPKPNPRQATMPNIGEAFLRPYQDAVAIAADPDCGSIVCHCERVTRAEILAACKAPISARTLAGISRRTRAMLGRCQGFYCAAQVVQLLAATTRCDVQAITGLNGPPVGGAIAAADTEPVPVLPHG